METTTLKTHSAVIKAIGQNQIDAYWSMIKKGSSISEAVASLANQFTDREFLESYGLSVWECCGQRMTNFGGEWEEEVFNFSVIASDEDEANEKANDYAFNRFGIHCVGASVGSREADIENLSWEW